MHVTAKINIEMGYRFIERVREKRECAKTIR